jgi:YHS domain-containing protein
MKHIVHTLLLMLCLQACTSTSTRQAGTESAIRPESQPALLSDSPNKASCVFLTTDENKNVVVSWVEIDSADHKYFYFAEWDAGKNSFSTPKSIPIERNASIHEEGMPKIAFKGDGTLVAIYETNIPLEGSRFGLSDLRYVLSADRGDTWTQPASVRQTTTQQGSVSFANILRLDDGELGVSWLGTNPPNTHDGRPVEFARSSSNNTFSAPVTLDPNACQCCRTAISCDGQGNIRVLYRDILPGSIRDISVASSSDNGQSFAPPAPFSNDQWVLDGCPHNGPSVASTAGTTYVAWYTGSDQNGVFYAELSKNNQMSNKRRLDAAGRFVQLCLMNDGTRMVAYNKNYLQGDHSYSKIVVNKINNEGTFESEISTGDSHASYPVIQQLDDRSVVVAWSDDGKIRYRLIRADQVDIPKEEAPAGTFATEGRLTVAIDNSTDPVCGMQMQKTTEMRNTLQDKGKTIGFCGEACKKQFKGT